MFEGSSIDTAGVVKLKSKLTSYYSFYPLREYYNCSVETLHVTYYNNEDEVRKFF